ncbi:MAG TPA: two-component regulator propeller domain-containing protein, partial [Bryobacteraceae bacterium]
MGQRTDYLFRHIGQSDGLLDNKVAALAQDRRGFIWIGSYNGLQRYDGIRFVNYSDLMAGEARNQTGVNRIDTVSGNRLFFYLGWNGQKLDWETNTVSCYTDADIRVDTTGRRRYEDSAHNFWIIGAQAIYLKAAGTGKLFHYPPSNVQDSLRHQVWAMGGGVFLLLDGTAGKAYSPAWNPIRHPLLEAAGKKTLKGILLDSRRKIWINSWADHFYQYDLLTGAMRAYSLSSLPWGRAGKPSGDPRSVNAFFEDHHGVLWLATAGLGLVRYCPEDGHFEGIARRRENSRGIRYSYEIYCIFQDREDNIWLGTDQGISIFNPYKPNFKILTHEDHNRNGLPDREVVGFTQLARGDLLVGTWGGGITVFDKRLDFKKNILFPGDIDQNMIWNFLELDGKIWVGCQHGWLHIYDSLHGTWSTLHPDALQNSTVRCLQKDARGNILFGLHNGRIAWWDKQENTFHVS